MPATDAVGKHGGEELLVVLPVRAQEVIATVTDRILRAVKTEPVVVCGIEVDVTIAIGATISDAGALDEAVIAANIALHRAQLAGGDCVEMRWPTASARLMLTS